MISQNVLSRQPRLIEHSYSPSEDHPKEMILHNMDNGAAMGVSYTEKRIIELIDGQRTMAEILQHVIQGRIASLATFRQLFWDLYRYGFFENSPWEIETKINGWGYWGRPKAWKAPFRLVALLGSFEKNIGKILISPIFHIFAIAMLGLGIWSNWELFNQVDPFLIADSTAMAVLVVVLSMMGGTLTALWFGAMVLRATHNAPVECIADYRYALPIFRLDGRRLRGLTTRQALHNAASPIIVLLFLSSLFISLAGLSIGARQEGLFHITATLWFSAFILLAPWNCTLLSREIMLRLRQKSIMGLMTRSLRRSFHYLIHTKLHGDPHELLFIAWGGWTLVSSLVFLRLAALAVRWKLPVLVTHFVKEENSLVLILLFIIVGVFATALLTTMISFFLWLGRDIVREIHHRYWPQKDYAIVGLVMAAGFICLVQFFWTMTPGSIIALQMPMILCGVILIVASAISWHSDGNGYEPLIHLLPLLCGILLFIQSITGSFNIGHLEIIGIEQQAPGQEPWLYQACIRLHTILLAAWIVYWTMIYGFLFKSPGKILDIIGFKIACTIGVIILCLGAAYWLPASDSTVEMISRILVSALFVVMCLCSCWIGIIRNYSTITLSCGAILIHIGLIRITRGDMLLSGPFLVAMGTLLTLGGLLLRQSAKTKTTEESDAGEPIQSQWTLRQTGDECLRALQRLYNLYPKTAIPKEMTDETMRRFFSRLNRISGSKGLNAIIRGIAQNTPWYATKEFVKLMPASVSVPRLTDWSIEKASQWLRKVPTFVDLNEELPYLAKKARLVMYQSGDRFIHQGKCEKSLYIVVSGNISVEIERPFGNKTVAVLSEGDFVGEIGFLSGAERTATVRAISPTQLLCINRNDINENTPSVLKAIQDAESGDSWLQALCQAVVFNEFPPSLSARVCLESRHINLNHGESLWLESDEISEDIAVFLLGKGFFIDGGRTDPLIEGSLLGLEESLNGERMKGRIRAEIPSRILLVNRELFQQALEELITPDYILDSIQSE